MTDRASIILKHRQLRHQGRRWAINRVSPGQYAGIVRPTTVPAAYIPKQSILIPKYETDEYDEDMLNSVEGCLDEVRDTLNDLTRAVLRAKVAVSMRYSADNTPTKDAFLTGELRGCKEDLDELLGELQSQIYTAKEIYKGRMW